ncbi:hypothetical protein F4860DRAFT_527550 [Xylaria cubensis]|nr:hypothetical protein F4860DRAFT_527550 [Xylaria cubensis]
MASDPSSTENNDLKFVEYLGSVDVAEKEEALREFLDEHNELSNGEPVSPRAFQGLVDEHFEPVNEARTYITQELDTTWGLHAIIIEENDQEAKELKSMENSGVTARQKYDDLLKKLIDIIIEAAPRVKWNKSKKHQQEIAKWIENKHFHFDGLVNDSNNSLMRKELETVRAALAQAKIELPVTPEASIKANKGTSTAGGAKRPPSDDANGNSGPAAKKLKQETTSGQWWGPYKSKLNGSDAFFEVIRQFKAYLVNPKDEPGTREYRLQMTRFLRRALDEVDLRDKLNQLLLKEEFQFRSPGHRSGDSTILISPCANEREYRLGQPGWYAYNDFKKIMGGGIHPQELLNEDLAPSAAIVQGMVALAESQRQSQRREVSIRGGGSSSKVADNYIYDYPFKESPDYVVKRIAIREGMAHRFRDPFDLWKELLEDAELPKGTFLQRVHEQRPPMFDPDRVGKTTSSRLKDSIGKVVCSSEWEAIIHETDIGYLDQWARSCEDIVDNVEGKVYNFLYENYDKIDSDEPTLLEPGGQNKPSARYAKTLTDKDFVKPILYAFRARAYQVMRYYLAWRYYLIGTSELSELLEQEKILYRVWDEHEDLYMNWENNKWFELSNPLEKRSLENRYSGRELLRLRWKQEVQIIDEALENLKYDPKYYNDPVKNEAEGKVIPAAEPEPYDPQPDVNEILALLEPLIKAAGNKKGKEPPKKASKPEVIDPTGTVEAMDVDKDEGNGGNNNTSGNANDSMDVDNESDVDPWTNPGGLVNVVDKGADATTSKPKDTSGALEYLRRTRDAYDKELNEIRSKNDRLDPLDPGNRAIIHSNNINIMAKNQMIWSLDTEIHNLNRAVDPLAEKSHGRGAEHKWSLPPEDYYYKYTKRIPKQPAVPLGITSFGRGPLPGEHPLPGHPRVFIGGCAGFGKDPGYEGDDEPEFKGGALFGPPPPGGSGGNSGGNSGGAATTGKPASGGGSANAGKSGATQPANQSGNSTTNMGNSKSDAMVETSAGAGAVPALDPAVLHKLRAYLWNKGAAEVTIREMTRIRNRGKALSAAQEATLEASKKMKKDNLERFKKLRSGLDAQTQAQVDLIEQEEKDKTLAYIKLVEEAAGKAEKNQKETTQTPLPIPQVETPLPQEQMLKQAEEVEREVFAEYKNAREKYEHALNKTPRMQKQGFQAETEDALRYLTEWVLYYRIAKTSKKAQATWNEPAESFIELQQRLDTLTQNWLEWRNGYGWGIYEDDLGHMNDQWVLDGIELIFQALKAVNINPGVSWWWEMHNSFWASRAKTLERKRQIWIWAILRQLNIWLSQIDPPVEPFLKTPPDPPSEWDEPTPSKEELIRQEYIRLDIPWKNSFLVPEPQEEQEQPESAIIDPTSSLPETSKPQVPPSAKSNKQTMITPSPTPGAELATPQTVEKVPPTPKTAVLLPQTPVSIPKEQLSPTLVLKQDSLTQTPTPAQKQKQPPVLVLRQDQLPSTPTPTPTPVKLPNQPPYVPELPTFVSPLPPPTPTPAATSGGQTLDAWPDFKELLQATWSSIIAHEALKQKDGNTSGVPGPDRPLWPKPVHVSRGNYYCL